VDVLIVDDVQLLNNKRKTQLEFLHTFSALVDAGRQIVICSDVPPKALKDLDAGLVGRFLSGLVVSLKKPDYATRLGILRAQARRIPAQFEDAVLQFLAEQIRGNARELVGALMQLDIHSRVSGGPVGLEDARAILAETIRERERRVDLRKIQNVVARYFGLAPEVLLARARQRHVARARQVAMYLARRYTGKSLAEVGKYFGDRDHTTVQCAVKKVEHLLSQAEGGLAGELGAIMETLEE